MRSSAAKERLTLTDIGNMRLFRSFFPAREHHYLDEVVAAVADPAAGGTTVFIGTVRSSDDGRDVSSLRYEAMRECG